MPSSRPGGAFRKLLASEAHPTGRGGQCLGERMLGAADAVSYDQSMAQPVRRPDNPPPDAPLLADLDEARSEAAAYGFDLPSDAAYERARMLLQRLSTALADASGVSVAIGEDGGIEITFGSGQELVIVDIPPSGRRMDVVVRDIASGEATPSAVVTEEDIVRWIERAA
jgi:hypothetical protein